MILPNIKFGTSGWRAVIGKDFTLENLRRVSHAIALHIKENPEYGFNGEEYIINVKKRQNALSKIPQVVIGYDTRYMSKDFAKTVAEVFAGRGISVIFSNIDAPTPVIAWEVIKNGAVGGVTITASHNPPHYNGFKWTPFWGGPAIPEITNDIESKLSLVLMSEINKVLAFDAGVATKIIKISDFHANYFKQILSLLDVGVIKRSGLKVAVDSVYGTARTYLGPILKQCGVHVTEIRNETDVLFGGASPDTDERNLSELKSLVLKNRLHLGLACDGDADRFGIIDSDGTWISPNYILGLLLEHLVKNRRMRGKVARSVMTSHFVDAIAKFYGLEVRETSVGFKYIGNLLRTGQYLIGGEESGGLSIMGHIPEKDGILACLLVAEMVAYERKPLKKIISDLGKKVGNYMNIRINLHIDRSLNLEKIIEKLKNAPPLKIAGVPVWRIDHTDGFKFIMKDGAWLGIRPSGTEPVVRIYAESCNARQIGKLLETGKKMAKGKF